LLEKAGYQFESYSVELSEIIDENLNCFDQVRYLSRSKMKQFLEHFGPKSDKYSFAMTFDTMVEFKGRALGKPKDKNEALGWLLDYRSKTQDVHTGCCLYSFKTQKIANCWTSTTTVHFKNYGEKEVLRYLDSQPDFMGKAGAYGIQDTGFDLYSHIEGEFSNVVGLPMKALAEKLK